VNLLYFWFARKLTELRAKGETHFFPVWYRKEAESKQRALAKGKITLNQHFPKFIPRWFNVTVKKQLGITDPLKVFHSFRHNFTTALDEAGVPLDMQERLVGHVESAPHSEYVHGTPIEAMKIAIEKLRYDASRCKLGRRCARGNRGINVYDCAHRMCRFRHCRIGLVSMHKRKCQR
jgi:integrase